MCQLPCNYREWAHFCPTVNGSHGCVDRPNFTKLGENIGRSFLHQKFVAAFGHLAAFSNAEGSNVNDVEQWRH